MILTRVILPLVVCLFLSACGGKDKSQPESEEATTAPPLPDTEIYLATVGFDGNDVTFGSILNVTKRPGYDNQPAFLPDGSGLLFSSVQDGEQSDIYRLEYRGMQVVQVTDTPESEYSPTPLPGGGFSTVRVEEDGAQRLWRMGDGGEGGQPILPRTQSVGYHGWLGDDQVALFIVGDDERNIPHSLHLANVTTGESQHVLDNPGRALRAIPDDPKGLSYVDKSEATAWSIKRLDLNSLDSTELVKTLEGSEDFVWTPSGGILMAQKEKLYHWPGSGEWGEIIDLKGQVIGPITRIEINQEGSRLAIVAEAPSTNE